MNMSRSFIKFHETSSMCALMFQNRIELRVDRGGGFFADTETAVDDKQDVLLLSFVQQCESGQGQHNRQYDEASNDGRYDALPFWKVAET